MRLDRRHIESGNEIPSEGYCDQPYAVVNDDGAWTCVMTTGRGHEGDTGQHVVAVVSADQGKTWEGPFDIEPDDGPEASWAMPLRVPETGRIYAFYTYNKDNQREVKTVDGGAFTRVDSFGVYAYKYSDDNGRTWSAERYEIPMRLFECDRNNVYGGEVQFFWGVGKPFTHKGRAYVCASKVGGFGPGFFVQNEGVLFASPNLLTEPDPAKHEWETLPDGEIGIRTPAGGGPIAGEFNATPMNDGSLYGTYRTIDGWSCHAISRDDGHTWDADWMTYVPGGRRVKNPRTANFVRRFANGKYLYWFCFHGGEVLGNTPGVENWAGYAHRNPIWLCGGIERDGHIHWSQPEVILYDDNVGNRM
ncbi:MAG: sialidase family protein, partial [Planctomycetota bacterium]